MGRVEIINDVSGFDYDKKMVDVISKYNATVIIQHSQGSPDVMQNKPTYNDVVEDIYFNLKSKIEYSISKGVNNIITDVGIGFGKTQEHNFEILNHIQVMLRILPVLVHKLFQLSFINTSIYLNLHN